MVEGGEVLASSAENSKYPSKNLYLPTLNKFDGYV